MTTTQPFASPYHFVMSFLIDMMTEAIENGDRRHGRGSNEALLNRNSLRVASDSSESRALILLSFGPEDSDARDPISSTYRMDARTPNPRIQTSTDARKRASVIPDEYL